MSWLEAGGCKEAGGSKIVDGVGGERLNEGLVDKGGAKVLPWAGRTPGWSWGGTGGPGSVAERWPQLEPERLYRSYWS